MKDRDCLKTYHKHELNWDKIDGRFPQASSQIAANKNDARTNENQCSLRFFFVLVSRKAPCTSKKFKQGFVFKVVISFQNYGEESIMFMCLFWLSNNFFVPSHSTCIQRDVGQYHEPTADSRGN